MSSNDNNTSYNPGSSVNNSSNPSPHNNNNFWSVVLVGSINSDTSNIDTSNYKFNGINRSIVITDLNSVIGSNYTKLSDT